MQSLQDYFQQAKQEGWAIGHFNFATADVLRAIVEGAQAARAPCVMVGTSEGEAAFLGMPQAVALVRAIREASGYPVFLNADHFSSFDLCKQAIDIGYDTVLFDGSRQPYEANVSEAKRVWEYAQTVRGGFMIESELGYLKGSSQVQEAVEITPADYTQPAQAADFVHRTGVTRLAIVFGNIHGIVTNQKEILDIPHLKIVSAAVPDTYIVLHGASGLDNAQIRAAIAAGVTNVHFNTELRVAYAQGIKEQLAAEPYQTTPYKLLARAGEQVRELVKQKVTVFMGR